MLVAIISTYLLRFNADVETVADALEFEIDVPHIRRHYYKISSNHGQAFDGEVIKRLQYRRTLEGRP